MTLLALTGCGDLQIQFNISITFLQSSPGSDGFDLWVRITGRGDDQEGGTLDSYRVVVTDPTGQTVHFETGTMSEFVNGDDSKDLSFLILTYREYQTIGQPDLVTVTLDLWGADLNGVDFSATQSGSVAL